MSSSSLADFSRPCPENGYYDVFLSFSNEDTGSSFTSNLYRSLRENKVYTFMKLEGEDIYHHFKMIGKSKMAVVIYSQKFASSEWCLRELDMILRRRKEKKMLIIPIFYKVDLHELKHLTGKTAKYLDKHAVEHNETIVEKWKNAVTSFGKVSGLSYKDTHGRYEYDFIEEVVTRIKEKLEEYDSFTQSSPHTTAGEQVYSVVTSFYFQKVDEIKGELLNIKPDSVNFYVVPKKQSSTCLILTNKTDNYVAFMIQKIADQPLKYRVYPSEGVVLPRSTCQVIITMQAQIMPSPDMECSDKFVVHSVKAKKDLLSSTDEFSSMFTKESGNDIDKMLMYVVYYDPDEESSSVPDHHTQLANKGLVYGADEFTSMIDIHPTKPWLLFGLSSGSVCIWNYKTRTEEKSFEVDEDESVWCPKFIKEKCWVVVGAANGFVRVFDYNTSEKVTEFKAHKSAIRCMAVHPTSPYVLTGSNDTLIKLWNFKYERKCIETFKGHSKDVAGIAFNPKDSTSFASVSWDGTIKIWSFGSSAAKFTIDAFSEEMNCVEYFVGNDNKLYLLSCSYDSSVTIWDYESKALVQSLEGHSENVTAIFVHPNLPIIITGSQDKTIHIWNKNTYQLELVWSCDLGEVCSIAFIKATKEVVIGCEDGMVVIKIVNTGT